MEISDRRDFLKKSVVAGASLLMAPSILNASLDRGITKRLPDNEDLIVPKSGGLKITGTFLDEISHDIPHQNWGFKEWDMDFQYMKQITTVH